MLRFQVPGEAKPDAPEKLSSPIVSNSDSPVKRTATSWTYDYNHPLAIRRKTKSFVFNEDNPIPENCDDILNDLCEAIEAGKKELIPIYKTVAQHSNKLIGWLRWDVNWPGASTPRPVFSLPTSSTPLASTNSTRPEIVREESPEIVSLVKKLIAEGKTPDQIKRSTGISKLITRKYL